MTMLLNATQEIRNRASANTYYPRPLQLAARGSRFKTEDEMQRYYKEQAMLTQSATAAAIQLAARRPEIVARSTVRWLQREQADRVDEAQRQLILQARCDAVDKVRKEAAKNLATKIRGQKQLDMKTATRCRLAEAATLAARQKEIARRKEKAVTKAAASRWGRVVANTSVVAVAVLVDLLHQAQRQRPLSDEQCLLEITKLIDTEYGGVIGPKVKRFDRKFAALLETRKRAAEESDDDDINVFVTGTTEYDRELARCRNPQILANRYIIESRRNCQPVLFAPHLFCPCLYPPFAPHLYNSPLSSIPIRDIFNTPHFARLVPHLVIGNRAGRW